MTTTDHRAEAERRLRLEPPPLATVHALLAIHDELRAIRDHLVPTPKEPGPEPLADWERDLLLAGSPHTETERLLAECDRLREERDKARTQIVSLACDLDDLRRERDDLVETIARVEDALGGESR